jgi:predicted RNA-binding protein YlqC (UPF0109 family)
MIEKAIRHLLAGIVRYPDDIHVRSVVRGSTEIFNVTVNQDDVGTVIGFKGKTINAIRTVVAHISSRPFLRINISNNF